MEPFVLVGLQCSFRNQAGGGGGVERFSESENMVKYFIVMKVFTLR